MPGLLSHCLVENCPERHMTSLDCCVNERKKKFFLLYCTPEILELAIYFKFIKPSTHFLIS